MLGIPTANLDVVPLKQQIDKLLPSRIYFGRQTLRTEQVDWCSSDRDVDWI